MNGPGLCSIHTHSVCCDGKSTLAEMAAAAYAAGVRYFGASGHSHTPIPADQGNVLPEDWTPYKQEVLRLRQEYAGRMEVLLGIEWDSCAQQPMPEGLDYWIGSVHDLRGGSPGCYYCVDWDRRMLEDCCRELFHGDFRGVYRQYYADVAEMAGRRPPVLGHIDLITKLNGDGGLFDEDSGDCWRSTPGQSPGATAGSPTPRSFCCGSGGGWADRSSSQRTPTGRMPSFTAMSRRRRGRGRLATGRASC